MSASGPQLSEFVAEAREHLSAVCDHLLNLERGQPEELNERRLGLLRAMHSVKGGAGFFGRKAIERIAHTAESALEVLPSEQLAGNAQAVDALLAAVDRIAALLDDVERSNEWDVNDVVARLEALATGEHLAPSSSEAVSVPEITSAPVPEVRHEHTIRLDLWACWTQQGIAPVEVVAALEARGALSQGELDAEGDLDDPGPAGKLVFTAQYATSLTADELLHEFALLGLSIAEAETPARAEPVARTAEAAAVAAPRSQPAPARAVEPPAPRPAEPAAAVERTTSIRIPVALVDRLMALAGELVLVRNQTRRSVEAQEPLLRSTAARLNSVTAEFQEAVLQTRMQPVANLFAKFPRLVRDLGRQLDKEIQLELVGGEVEVDKTVLDALSDPLVHLVRNCCDHGLETPAERELAGKPSSGTLTLSAEQQGDEITLTIADDGRGIDRRRVREHALKQGIRTAAELDRLGDSDLLGLILLPGFSTARQVSDLSGRGVGMDVVRSNLQQIGGRVEIESVEGQGTRFRLRLPLTLAIIPALLVSCKGQTLAVPQKDLEQLVLVRPGDTRIRLEATLGQPVLRKRGKLLPVASLAATLGLVPPETAFSTTEPTLCAVVKAGGRRFALVIDAVLKSEEIVVKPVHAGLRQLDVYSGTTILGDGHVALILDCQGLARRAGLRLELESSTEPTTTKAAAANTERVLLVRHAGDETFAVPLRSIRRIVRLAPAEVQRLGSRTCAAIDAVPYQLLQLNELTEAAAPGELHEAFALLPRRGPAAVGLLVSQLLDTAEAELVDQADAPARVRTAMVDERVTRIVDLNHLPVGNNGGATKASALVGRSVLLVEDTRFFRELVRGYLEAAGCRVTEAHHGAEGLTALERGQFDLVISDLEMPELDGWNFARVARERLQGRPLPMLALSTLEGAADRARALASGFDEYQVKLNRDSLLDALGRLLAGSAERSAAHAS
jgi:two-component system chemotaxis sensor kinase CheA